jgi:hypothetical protein
MSKDSHEYPDAIINVSVVCENHDIQSGLKQLNPILQEIVKARAASGVAPMARTKNPHFGRLTFSQRA